MVLKNSFFFIIICIKNDGVLSDLCLSVKFFKNSVNIYYKNHLMRFSREKNLFLVEKPMDEYLIELLLKRPPNEVNKGFLPHNFFAEFPKG